MASPASKAPDLFASLAHFSTELYNQVQATLVDEQLNIGISPLAVQLAVGLALMGTVGETSNQLRHGLRLDGANQATMASEFAQLVDSVGDNLRIINLVFINKAYHFKGRFNELAEQLQSETYPMDFAEPEVAAALINQCVKDRTRRRIRKIVSTDMLNGNQQIVLVNAAYFKALWEVQFDVRNTFKQPFFVTDTQSVLVDMMHVDHRFDYAELPDLDAKVVILKYKRSDLSMVVLLPCKVDGLAELDAKLKATDLTSIVDRTERVAVALSLPKFRTVFGVRLADSLRQMGMPAMFTSGADFSQMIGGPGPVCVAEIVHKAFIRINEKGTEASAEQMVMGALYSGRPELEFTADHPFRYCIRNSANVILFDGCFRRDE